MNNKLSSYSFNLLIFLPALSYILGYLFNENSAGMGDFAVDSKWIQLNIKIFIENNLMDAIFHPDLFGNRTPLVYVINKIFNPFFGDFEKYRLTVFLMSLISPLIFYKFLELKFNNIDKKILFLLASIIYLSPYYRTSGYWGLNENYSVFATMLSLLYLEKFNKFENNKFINLILIIIFSSFSVYFDQKFLIIPIICFISILRNRMNLNYKFITILLYFIFSLPYLYLIYKWQGIVPPTTQLENPKTVTAINDIKNLYFYHIGYSSTLISFYLLPLILLTGTKEELIEKVKNIFNSKILIYLLLLFTAYFLFIKFNYNFEKFTISEYWIGLGVVHKLTSIIFDNVLLREIVTYIFIFCSFFLIMYFYLINKKDFFLVLYFITISCFLWPLMQEYFDPIIFIIAISFFTSIKNINKKNLYFITTYFSFFLLI